MGHVEPRVRPDQVRQPHHMLHRHAAPHIGEIIHLRAVIPCTLGRAIGEHPVHVPDRAQILDQRGEFGVIDHPGLCEGQVIFADNADIADVVAGAFWVGFADRQRHQPVSRFIDEPQPVFISLGGAAQPDDIDLARALPCHAVARGQRRGFGRLFRQEIGLDPVHPVRDALEPAPRVQKPFVGQFLILVPAPLPANMAQPGAGSFHDIDKRMLGGPIRDAVQAHGHRGVGQPFGIGQRCVGQRGCSVWRGLLRCGRLRGGSHVLFRRGHGGVGGGGLGALFGAGRGIALHLLPDEVSGGGVIVDQLVTDGGAELVEPGGGWRIVHPGIGDHRGNQIGGRRAMRGIVEVKIGGPQIGQRTFGDQLGQDRPHRDQPHVHARHGRGDRCVIVLIPVVILTQRIAQVAAVFAACGRKAVHLGPAFVEENGGRHTLRGDPVDQVHGAAERGTPVRIGPFIG